MAVVQGGFPSITQAIGQDTCFLNNEYRSMDRRYVRRFWRCGWKFANSTRRISSSSFILDRALYVADGNFRRRGGG